MGIGEKPGSLILRNDKWPDLKLTKYKKEKRMWLRDLSGEVFVEDIPLGNMNGGGDLEGKVDPNIKWEAIGALANWRTALQFLSRLDEQNGKIFLTEPDNEVIDRFFTMITQGCRPSLGHYMLAHLSKALRIQTIYTTNFDTLIEEAYGELGVSLRVFDVHQKAGLPDSKLVLTDPVDTPYN